MTRARAGRTVSDGTGPGGLGIESRWRIGVTVGGLFVALMFLGFPPATPNPRAPTPSVGPALPPAPSFEGVAVAVHRSSTGGAAPSPSERNDAVPGGGVAPIGSTIVNPPCPSNATWSTPGYANWTSSACFTTSRSANGSLIYCIWTHNATSPIWNATCIAIPNTLFGTPCSLLPPNATIGSYGLNLSVLSTPANGTGPGPLNFTWNASVSDGGLPPY